MKSTPRHKSHLRRSLAVLAFCVTAVHSETVTFSFQQGDLRKDGELYGAGADYSGALDGHIVDANTTAALTTLATTTIGNQFQTGSGNGRNFVSLYSYDLTELSDFIAANTSSSSSATVTSVSFKLIASGNTSGTVNGGISLFRTDPFTSGATWPTTDGSTAWTSPYQSGLDETQFKYTGGGSALTANLGGTSPSTGSKTAGSPMEWTSSAGFVAALGHALAQPDKKLHLMAARPLQNSDGRVPVHSGSAATVDERPELLITLLVNSLSDWTGASSTSWATAGNWTTPPASGASVRFNNSSTANLATVLDQDFNLSGIALIDPSGPVSIGGANTLTLGAGGLDLSAATQDLTITAPLVLSEAQTWNLATGRTLSVSGNITSSGLLTTFGAGKVTLGAANILPNGAGAGNLSLGTALDLNGFSQTVNALTGNGTVDNTGAAPVTLTVGNNDAASTFGGIIQDTGGDLALVKTGSGSLTLTGANDFSGGFTNSGTGNVAPNNNTAFGTGPVVMNGATIYGTATVTIANELALNGATLRIGGGGGKTITWNGPVTATGASGLSADGGTGGITLGSTLDIAGAAFTSYANGTTHNIIGDISGTGGTLEVTLGTLQLSGTNSYTGTTTLSGTATLRLQPTGTISSSSNIVINGTGNFNVRNTNNWVYSGTITGEGTGSINLNTGTNATLAGDISGVATVNANSTGTDTTVSGAISGPAAVNVQGTSTLRLSGANSYSGATNVSSGTLVLAASNVLPDTTPVSIGNATLDAATFTDAAGTLAVTHAASTINLGVGAALTFAPSHEVDWTGGTLNLTGTFVPGASLNFGSSTGLTDQQLLQITATGYTNFDLNDGGFLIATEALGFTAWQAANGTEGGLDEDHDNDGVSNGVEFFLGGATDTSGFTALPGVVDEGGSLSITWIKADTGYDGVYGTDFVVETSETLTGTWSPQTLGDTVVITGNAVKFTFPAGTINFARLKVTGP
jgi:autotransporter-associated beta strand protein